LNRILLTGCSAPCVFQLTHGSVKALLNEPQFNSIFPPVNLVVILLVYVILVLVLFLGYLFCGYFDAHLLKADEVGETLSSDCVILVPLV